MIASRVVFLALLLLLVRSPAASAQVLLKPKPQEGKKYTHEISVQANQTLTIAGMEVKTESDTAMRFSIDVAKHDDQGRIAQRTKMDSIRSSLMLPGGNIAFDSQINLAKSDLEQYAFIVDAFRAMAGASYTTVVDAENRFVSAEGLDEILKPAQPQVNELLKSHFNLDKLRLEHERSLARYPDKPVKEGDTWDQVDEMDLGSGQTLKMDRRYEYRGTIERDGRTLDQVRATDRKVLSLEVDANSSLPFRISKTDLEVAKSEGTILFDRQLGREVENSRVLHLKGKLTLVINGMDFPTDLDLKMETKDVVQ